MEYDYVIYRTDRNGDVWQKDVRKLFYNVILRWKVATCDTFKNAVIKMAKLKAGEYAIRKETRKRSRK